MDTLISFLEQHGYLLLGVVGFAEFAGIPLASAPILVVAGAMVGMGVMDPTATALAAAAGAFIADSGWYAAARWRGVYLVDWACNLTSNPTACVHHTTATLARVGAAYIIPAKFVPGTANLVAASAGFTRITPRRFLFFDALAVLLWAGFYTLLGRIFTPQVESLVAWILRWGRWAAVAAVGLIVGAVIWRWIRAGMHRKKHPDPEAAIDAPPGIEGAGSVEEPVTPASGDEEREGPTPAEGRAS